MVVIISIWFFGVAHKGGWPTCGCLDLLAQNIFIPRTQPTDPTTARLLILDGHKSHESTEFMYLCYYI